MSNNVNENDICSYEEYYYIIFSTTNLCRLIFYTPIIFCVSVVGSVAYDYLTYKEINSKKSQ